MYDQLKIKYNHKSHENDLIVYRGQIISSIELQIIKDNIGQLISLNSFISTSLEEEVAIGFSSMGDPSGERVLFRIFKVNKNITNSKPFVDISIHSQFTDEKVVLFMAGSIFEIKSVHLSDDMNIIELHLCNDNVYE